MRIFLLFVIKAVLQNAALIAAYLFTHIVTVMEWLGLGESLEVV